MFPRSNGRVLLGGLLLSAQLLRLGAADETAAFILRTNDVVAFVGGTDVATARLTGHLETLLAVKFPGARFRNLGWEGDTVFAQPRDVGFPPLAEQLKRAGAIDGSRLRGESTLDSVGGFSWRKPCSFSN